MLSLQMIGLTLFVIFYALSQHKLITALKCYQGQQNSSLSIDSELTTLQDCPSTTEACVYVVYGADQVAVRSCQTTKCFVSSYAD
jgi:hypothetical protein